MIGGKTEQTTMENNNLNRKLTSNINSSSVVCIGGYSLKNATQVAKPVKSKAFAYISWGMVRVAL